MNTLYIVHSFKGKNKFKPLAMGHIQDVVHVNYFLQIGRERLYIYNFDWGVHVCNAYRRNVYKLFQNRKLMNND